MLCDLDLWPPDLKFDRFMPLTHRPRANLHQTWIICFKIFFQGFGNGQTNRCMDRRTHGQVENTMPPPAGVALWRHQIYITWSRSNNTYRPSRSGGIVLACISVIWEKPISATPFSVASETAPSKDLNDVSANTRMATSLPGTVTTSTNPTMK